MAHQVLITFDIDEARVQENAEKEAGRQIAKTVIDGAFSSTYYRENLMRQYVQDIIKEMLAPHKEEIITEAVKLVADSLRKSKLAKDKLSEVVNGDKSGKEV